MDNLVSTNGYQLPVNIEDLSKFVLVGREKLISVKAEIRAIDKVGFAKEVREQIIKETKNKKNIIQHAIVITSDKTFEKQLKIVGVPELLVLPKHSIFIKLINEMAKGDFDKKVLSIAYPKLVENEVLNNKNIKYEINSEVYINMVLNNVSVFPYLKSINQLLMQTGSTINQIYNIVCLDIQAPYIKRKTNELNLNKIDIHIEPLSINQII